MASITKRGKTWQYCVSRMVDGKYKPIRKGGFSTKKEATVAAAAIEANIGKNGFPPIQEDIPFTKYFMDWVRTYKTNISDITMRAYTTTYNKLYEYFGEIPIQQITKRKYQEFMNILGTKFARDTNRKLNGYVRTCLLEAIDEGLIKNDFTRNITITGASSKKGSEKFLNLTDTERLLYYLKDHVEKNIKNLQNVDNGIENLLLLLALTSGMRYGELVGLIETDFNFKESFIRVERQWKYKEGGGFGDLKNESSERTITIDTETMLLFKKFFKYRTSHSDNQHQLVFFDDTSDILVVTNDRLNDVLRAALKYLKITPLITAHGLRHTHASILLFEEVNLIYVSERLGHSSIEITSSTYAHVLKELRERDSRKTADVFKKMMLMPSTNIERVDV
ncbi:tyrosine-type recombinase/integrase [Lysinibacillus fusiformis]|uniref:tyrosine-type recombinase/integrase n=1 Tax=Lysinibacillus fusiformis TaxID=28031 RepID=UPI003AAF9E50